MQFRIPAAIAAAAMLLSGCGGNKTAAPGAPASGAGTKKIGVTLLGRTDPFYQDMEKAMVAEAKLKGMELDVQDGNHDLSTQLAQVENFISQKKDALILCPADSDGIGGAVEKANAAGIPVFTADIKANKGTVITHVASDNVKGGELAGERMAKLLNGKGKVVIIDYPSVASVRQRTEGFAKAVAKFPGIQIVERPNGKAKRDEALTQTENMLQKYPDLAGIFAINDNTALGALKAIDNSKRTNVVLIGYDGDPEARTAILSGTALKADAVQYPDKIGKQTIDVIDAHFRGEKTPAFAPVEVGLIDQESLKKEAAAK
ncbi:MAG TPA: substrate-binding domain-containing protein [Armatimonadota bacterium]|jgi:ribose transport system substrate-binding protein